jgi:hypothetical protein
MTDKLLQSLIAALPYLGFFTLFCMRLEHRLTKIETDVKWLKKEHQSCQPTSDDPTL